MPTSQHFYDEHESFETTIRDLRDEFDQRKTTLGSYDKDEDDISELLESIQARNDFFFGLINDLEQTEIDLIKSKEMRKQESTGDTIRATAECVRQVAETKELLDDLKGSIDRWTNQP